MSGQVDYMAKQYSHFTVAVPPEELEEFEQKLQGIKDYFGIERTSTVIQKMVDEWADLHWKAQKYDQIKDTILGFEAYHKYKKGELIYAERDRRTIL
ncbi:MAG: hypothetical protein AYK18_07940 [Theionarchaea archaeon DG-70]|nr:MAG: hypothetical protein AYK18_07940 [Theionarchaea archaeon DG-70]